MERHFDEELKELRGKLLNMAALAERSIAESVKSLVRRDSEMAHLVVLRDDEINMVELELEELCLRLLALRQPTAKDLRFIAAAMKITNDLERIGDLSVNIAQRSLNLLREPLLKPLIDIPWLADLVQKMVSDSLHAFVRENAELARSVCLRDDKIDQLNHQIFRELLAYMMEDGQTIARSVDLILIGRNLERIADHATNIAEDVVYMVQGKTIKHHIEEKIAAAQPPQG